VEVVARGRRRVVVGTDPAKPPKRILRKLKRVFKKLKPWQQLLAALIGAFAIIIPSIIVGSGPVAPSTPGGPTPGTPIPSTTASAIPSTTASALPGSIGKPVRASKPIDLLSYYSPSGFMGDIGDITKEEPVSGLVRMTYVAEERGPHEWQYKYIDGKINPQPCGFAGIMLLDGYWGQTRGAGYDLQRFTTISWEARSLSGNVFVQFVAGGANWMWDGKTRTMVGAPYPDSLPNLQLGQPTKLTGQWQHFEFPLGTYTTAADRQDVIAPFGWVISLDSNDGDRGQPPTFVIEVRNISYG
jgi:hypothetical protein